MDGQRVRARGQLGAPMRHMHVGRQGAGCAAQLVDSMAPLHTPRSRSSRGPLLAAAATKPTAVPARGRVSSRSCAGWRMRPCWCCCRCGHPAARQLMGHCLMRGPMCSTPSVRLHAGGCGWCGAANGHLHGSQSGPGRLGACVPHAFRMRMATRLHVAWCTPAGDAVPFGREGCRARGRAHGTPAHCRARH